MQVKTELLQANTNWLFWDMTFYCMCMCIAYLVLCWFPTPLAISSHLHKGFPGGQTRNESALHDHGMGGRSACIEDCCCLKTLSQKKRFVETVQIYCKLVLILINCTVLINAV